MKAISIRQPWATLIALGIKRVENRSWVTSHRGRLLIHAAKKITPADMEAGRKLCEKLGRPFPDTFPTGGLIAEVEVTALVWRTEDGSLATDHPTAAESDLHGYDGQSVGFYLENPRQIPFTAMRGQLGLFNV